VRQNRRRRAPAASRNNGAFRSADGYESDTEDVKKKPDPEPDSVFPEEAFFMINQVNWEDDVIWNGDDVKHKVRLLAS
jgi:hypothetical protein